MIKYANEIEEYKNLHGGSGIVRIERNVTSEDNLESIDMFARVILEKDASIGYHEHVSDSEVYYILEGNGIFIDNGQIKKEVKKGASVTYLKGKVMVL